MLGTFLVVMALASGGIGIPVGMPPGFEDPMLGRFAPADPQVFIAWSGVGPLDGNDPTTRWMAQPEIQTMVKKLVAGFNKLGDQPNAKSSGKPPSEEQLFTRLIIKSIDAASHHGLAFFADGIDHDFNGKSADYAVLIPLNERREQFDQLFVDLKTAVAKSTKSKLTFVEKNGQSDVLAVKGNHLKVLLKDDYLVGAFGPGMLDRALKNLQTPPPTWFTEHRRQLAVKHFSSIAYISSNILQDSNFIAAQIIDFKSFKALCCVSGMDDQGTVTRSTIDFHSNSKLDTLLPNKPLNSNELARMAGRPLLGFQTHVPVDAVIQFIADAGKKIGKAPVTEAEDQIQDLFGISLKDQLLHFMDGVVTMSFDYDPELSRPELLVTFGITDDMSFSEIYQTVIDAVSQWPEVSDRLENFDHRGYNVYKFSPPQIFLPVSLCWSHAGDQLIFASGEDLVTRQIDQLIDGSEFSKTQQVQQLVEFGQQSKYGNPVAVTTLDPVKLLKIIFHFQKTWALGKKQKRVPGFKSSDIPTLKVLSSGVDSSVTGVYRTKTGLETFGRSTLPGSSPPVTAFGFGAMNLPQISLKRMARQAQRKQTTRIQRLALACLNFEVKHQRFPATANRDGDKKPLLSWRVHLLPQLGYLDLYQQFRLEEPWDSEHNQTLISKMPAVYCHRDGKPSDGKTIYLGIAGADGVLGHPQKTAIGANGLWNVVDGSSNTLLVVGVEPTSSVTWTRPVDFNTADGGEKVIEDTDENNSGTPIGFCDGSTFIVDDLNADQWEAMMNINGGEPIDREALLK
jgi:hypothetical protein